VPVVDVVVVSYNSAEHLRGCVEGLSRLDWVQVIVVDNGSADPGLDRIAELDVRTIETGANLGFAGGCNAGWRVGESRYVLFLNPDARIASDSLQRLVGVLESRREAAIVAPRIVGDDGRLQHSLRRYPRLRSTYAQALFLHRLFPSSPSVDEKVQDPAAYERPGVHDWASGACLLVRRDVLERIGGWDAGFFFYCEDIDLCRRVHDLGCTVRYEPSAEVVHEGGGSAPRSVMLPHLAASRVRYAQLHRSRIGALAERIGIALEAATHVLIARGGRPARVGHARSLRVALVSRR
jgi:GT2 family glycosyltransferase